MWSPSILKRKHIFSFAHWCALVMAGLLTAFLIACHSQPPAEGEPECRRPEAEVAEGVPQPEGAPPAGPLDCLAPCAYEVRAVYPHDPAAFTQGLVMRDGQLYEGTGLNGASSLRRVDLETGAVLQRVDLPEALFGEGIEVRGDRIYQLTWRNRVAIVYDRATFLETQTFSYETEGWGLTSDETRLIMSDGTARLYFRDPETFALLGHVDVHDSRGPVSRLNELEYVNGEVLANLWQTDRIARIDPATGRVRGYIDLRGLLPAEDRRPDTDVLNGIAWDAARQRLYVTGKRWPKLFEIALVPIR
jgi:glutamine cyclotransferase